MKVKVRFKHDKWSVNPLYPHGWRGETGMMVWFGKTAFRIRWFYAHRENDWQRLDTATHTNISPRWAKWFHYSSYYGGFYRYIRHLTIGHFNISYLPFFNFDSYI